MIKSISLDSEVAASVEAEAQREERSFSQIVNRRLRTAFGITIPKHGAEPVVTAKSKKVSPARKTRKPAKKVA